MNFEKIIKERYSVRKYKEEILKDEELNCILEAGMLAPTGCNNQPQRIYVIKSRESISKIRQLSRCAFDAPVVLLIALNEQADWKNPLEKGLRSGIQDVSITAAYMMLRAWDLGIGSCWVNYFKPTEVKAEFGLPKNETPVLLLTLGYPADDSEPRDAHFKSKHMDDIVKFI